MDVRLGIPLAWRSIIAILLLPLHLAACTSWQAQPSPLPGRLLADSGQTHIRLVLRDSGTVEIWHPQQVGDSIVGSGRVESTRVSVPVSRVARIEVRQHSADRTVLLVLGLAAGAALIAATGYAIGNAFMWCIGGGCE